jgi:hypothetical protein
LHVHTLRTKYQLGDRVRFTSPTQHCSGSGIIEAITIYFHGRLDYMILLEETKDHFHVQPGILEEEISLPEGQ